MKIIQGDCLDIMKDIPDLSVDMVLTSPPYDNLRDYSCLTFDKFKMIAKELFRIIKNNSVIVWVVGDATIKGSETGTSFRQALYFMELGFNLHDTMIYEKNSSTYPAKRNSNRYTQIFEYMFVFSKGKPKANLICDKKNKWKGYKDFSKKQKNEVPEFSARTNIWKYTTSFNNKHGHPAVFPIKLANDHILSWSNEGDIILDPFMGSGTTGIACVNTGRDFIGIELDEVYYKMACERIEEVDAQLYLWNHRV